MVNNFTCNNKTNNQTHNRKQTPDSYTTENRLRTVTQQKTDSGQLHNRKQTTDSYTTENRLWTVTQQKTDSRQLDPDDQHHGFLQGVECFPTVPLYRGFIVLLTCQVRSIQIRLGTLVIPPCPMVNARAINSPGFVIIFIFWWKRVVVGCGNSNCHLWN
jgi:hypothetical protein